MPLPTFSDLREVPWRAHAILRLCGLALLLFVTGATAYLLARQSDAQHWVDHTLAVENQLYALLSAVQDAETSERGYFITRADAYLEPYDRAVKAVPAALSSLTALTADNATQQQTLRALRPAIDAKLAELGQTITLVRDGQGDAALGRVRSDTGKTSMDTARRVIAEMRSEEEQLLTQRENAAWRIHLALQSAIAAASLIIVLLFLLTTRETRQRLAEALATNEQLTAANTKIMEEMHEKERIADQLRQSQKMEAVGQLTGGIAHDFNNMLAVVISSFELIKRRLARGDGGIEPLVDAGIDGARRASDLTRRLLAFARRQPLAPQILDVNQTVSNLSELLRRTVGETIRFETVLAGGLWRTKVDRGQLESSIVNVVTNARDAMPGGGKLTIETSNTYLDDAYAAQHAEVRAGQYVLIAVTDTGIGMPPEGLARAFEPFYTTKPPGEGTGLGLAQVFGFIKQSAGHVKIYSEPGQGTTLKLYLPKFVGQTETVKPAIAAGISKAKPEETVLIVEDDAKVRQLSAATLRELGYRVLEADSAASALQFIDTHPEIALLFTDVVMPDVNGRTLAEQAQRRRPELKVLYTTGYTRNAIIHNGMLDEGVHFLPKPISIEELARKVRAVLDHSD